MGGPSDRADGWVTLVMAVAADELELVSDRLWILGAAGIEEQIDATDPGGVVLRAGFPDATMAAAAREALAAEGRAAATAAVDDDGLDAWREFAVPVRAGSFVIVPAWLDPPPLAAGERPLILDPGRTFGSGSHPTTRLCVAALASLVRPGHRVLDVGTGSGVLAVAAAILGASVTAIDVDAASPAAVAANAAANEVAELVDGSTRSLADITEASEPFEVVLANLLAPIVVELGPDLVRAVAPGGTLVVSGLLADRWRETVDHVLAGEASASRIDGGSTPTGARSGLAVRSVVEEDGWVAVVLERSAPTIR